MWPFRHPICGVFQLDTPLDMVFDGPVGEVALYVLAIAACASFGVGGVLLGLYVGVRSITRDEARFETVAKAVESMASDQVKLRGEWQVAQENLEQLLEAVETRRRRIAASDSAKKREEANQPQERELSVAEQRDMIRRRMRRIV